MASTTLIKALLHNSVADSVYKEITSKTGRYYYFLGTVLEWNDPVNLPLPIDSDQYERDVRKDIVLVKEIQPSDVAFITERITWQSNVVYDMYDDSYSSQLVGIDLSAGGSEYSQSASVTISGGGGVGAAASVQVDNGAVASIDLISRGYGYTSPPSVTISDAYGSGAVANAVINYASSGAANLQSSLFYVVTDEFNIYKCLDNNYGARSLFKPTQVTPESFYTNDGYKWKFMGNVPPSLRNRFLTLSQIPVTNSITSQFYSAGEIRTINVTDTGNNYSFAQVVVEGDGYLESDPVLVIQPVINSAGAGYTYANVTIDPPISNTVNWTANTYLTVGQFVNYENNIYEVVQGGVTAARSPVHTFGTFSNGDTGLKFISRGLTANAVIVGGSITGLVNLDGGVKDIVIVENGSGYLRAPSISFSGGGGSNASAYCNITGNIVTRTVVTDIGKNYNTAPTVTFGTSWSANTVYYVNDQVFYGTRLYTVTTSGTSNTTAPTHVSGSPLLGTCAFTYAGRVATGYATLRYGAGYRTAPNVTISGDGSNARISFQAEKTEAIITPYIEDGKITRLMIQDGGVGYTHAAIAIVGDGTGAQYRVNFSEGDLDTIQATSELLAIPGAIHSIKVVSGGYGYTGASVTIEGDGTGATARVTIVNNRIAKIDVITEGRGYTYADVVIAGTGKGAKARAILPPFGGHGRDAVKELFSRTIGFYSTIGLERNQGFEVTNDYRQFGIIKNLRNYDGNKFFNNVVGSSCWLLSGNVDTSIFVEDSYISRTTDGVSFLIVSSKPSGMLVLSTESGVPTNGDAFRSQSGNVFVSSGVTKPDVDKYSGDLLYIDNRPAFSSTDEQAVSIKTVFKY